MKHPRAPHWYGVRHYREMTLPPAVADWLMDTTSLTARLQRLCGAGFRVRLLGQHRSRPDPSEARALDLRPGVEVVAREVQLLCSGQPVVFARSVIPYRSLRGRHRRLLHLGERPLGAYLFAQPDLRRVAVELACLHAGERLFELATRGLEGGRGPVWGRRSLFQLGRSRLLVAEFFLPDLVERSQPGPE